MENQKEIKSRRNLLLLIILFLLISLTLLTGKFLLGDSANKRGTLNASASVERPQIVRTGQDIQPEENKRIEAEAVEAPVEKVEERDIDQPKEEQINMRLFFFKLDDQGQVILKSVLRPVNADRVTLEEAIQEILKGPSSADLDKGYLSLVPDGSVLNGVKIVSNTARLDFSEEFSFNPLGYEGFNAQLKQLVYTATEFQNVDQVLFTINGELRDYINGEAIYTGDPLSRDSF